jgi:hypothetical protein
MIYSQSDTLYDLIPHAPQPSNDTPRSTIRPHANGVVGPISSTTVGQLTGKLSQLTIATNPTSCACTTNLNLAPAQTSKVNMVQSTTSKNPQQSRGKKKNNNNKKKKNSSEKQARKPKTPMLGGGGGKVKYPCMVCKEDHFTKYFPHLAEAHQHLE